MREYCYYTGELAEDELEPAGVVRDIKDAQRELNKNRSQRMHVVNQQSLGVKFWSGVTDDNFKRLSSVIAINRVRTSSCRRMQHSKTERRQWIAISI